VLRDQMGGTDPVTVLAYHHGPQIAANAEFLRAVVFERPVAENLQSELDRGASATFPIKAADLMPDLEGPALGAAMKQLEARWIASDFQLSKAQLLAE
jgi:poly(A) polymerase